MLPEPSACMSIPLSDCFSRHCTGYTVAHASTPSSHVCMSVSVCVGRQLPRQLVQVAVSLTESWPYAPMAMHLDCVML